MNNQISLTTLSEAMYLGKLGDQYVIKSKAAFEHIEYIEYYTADAAVCYQQKEKRDRQARNSYRALCSKPWKRGEIYMMNIIDREMKNEDVRI